MTKKKLFTVLSLSATLGLVACSSSNDSAPAAPVPRAPAADSSGAQPTTTNKILGTDFRIGKTLAFVEEIPGTEDSFVSVHMFEEGADVTCDNIMDQEPHNVLHVTARLDMNKAIVIEEMQEEGDGSGSELPRPSAEEDEARRESSLNIPEGYERSEDTAQAVFINRDGEQDIATGGYLIITSRTDREIEGIIAVRGKDENRVSQLDRTEFRAEVCSMPVSDSDEFDETVGYPDSESESDVSNP